MKHWAWSLIFIAVAVQPLSGGPLVRGENTTLSLPAALPQGSFTKENAFGSLTFSRPVAIANAPGETNRLFVLEQTGNIIVLPDLQNPAEETFLNITAVDYEGEAGLLGLAFHPNYTTNGYFYVFYTVRISDIRHQRLSRFSVSAINPNRGDAASELPMITQIDEASNHNGGDIHFGPDGYLYVSLGDEGGGGDEFDNGRFIDKDFFSAMLRIDVDQRPGSLAPNNHPAVHVGTYAIPPDNPFIGLTNYMGYSVVPTVIRTEFWAAGFRNPWRFSFDLPTGRLFCGDVGQGSREEIDLVTKGTHYGWSFREGTQAYISGPGGSSPPNGFAPADPIHDYGRTEGRSVTGGVVYRGQRFTELFEDYIFGDYETGRVWAMRFPQSGGTTVEQITTIPNVSAFGTDPGNGDILAASIGGTVHRIVRAGAVTGPSIPTTLSATGAFSNLTNLISNTGIVPYEPNVSFWSDDATKQRWFSIPNLMDTMTYNQEGAWGYPTGQVWIKHFELELTPNDITDPLFRVETRFLVKTSDAAYGVTYRWNSAQTDADLVAEEGMDEVFMVQDGTGTTTQTWRYPSRNECMNCHTAAADHVLGFHTAQLNRTFNYDSTPYDQLSALSEAGYFDSPLAAIHALPRLAPMDDATQSLEHRVRSYLAVNCSQCHRPNGPALGFWDARPEITTAATQLINGPLVNSFGDASAKVTVPNSVTHSMVMQRMLGNGVPRMPPIGSNKVDQTGIQLISDWITQDLPSWQSMEDWQIAQFGSSNLPEAAADADPDGDDRTNRFEFLTNTDPMSSNDFWSVRESTNGNHYQINYQTVPNRAAIIDTSTDATSWVTLEQAVNEVIYPAASLPIMKSIPIDADIRRFFRIRFVER